MHDAVLGVFLEEKKKKIKCVNEHFRGMNASLRLSTVLQWNVGGCVTHVYLMCVCACSRCALSFQQCFSSAIMLSVFYVVNPQSSPSVQK